MKFSTNSPLPRGKNRNTLPHKGVSYSFSSHCELTMATEDIRRMGRQIYGPDDDLIGRLSIIDEQVDAALDWWRKQEGRK